jgi:hypothetical protein
MASMARFNFQDIRGRQEMPGFSVESLTFPLTQELHHAVEVNQFWQKSGLIELSGFSTPDRKRSFGACLNKSSSQDGVWRHPGLMKNIHPDYSLTGIGNSILVVVLRGQFMHGID